jgi:crotonobetainyl-CoA:carnitine CoA-transferase CaiB-like acyl-CoA transferase
MKSILKDLEYYARKARRQMRERMTEKVSTRIDTKTKEELLRICDEAHLTVSEILRALIYAIVEYRDIERRWGEQ